MSSAKLLLGGEDENIIAPTQDYTIKIDNNKYMIYKGTRAISNNLIMKAVEECKDLEQNTFPTTVKFYLDNRNIGVLEYQAAEKSFEKCTYILTTSKKKKLEMTTGFFVGKPFHVEAKPHFKDEPIGPAEIRRVSFCSCFCSLFPPLFILAIAGAIIFIIGIYIEVRLIFGLISILWFSILLFFGVSYMCLSAFNIMKIKVLSLIRISNKRMFAEVYTQLRYSTIPTKVFEVVAYKSLNQNQLMMLLSAVIRFTKFGVKGSEDENQMEFSNDEKGINSQCQLIIN